MNAVSRKQILFPPGRVVQGSLYKQQDKDANGAARVYPPGHPKAGQPKISWFFAVAIPKNRGENAWWDTPWGREIFFVGQSAWPQGQWQHQSFAWKIEDGDSQVPNKRNRKNCNTEGMPGCWIVNFSSSFAPKICDERGQPILEPDVVKNGYWVEVYGSVASNETASNPGVYVNHEHVSFRGRDKEIFSGTDPSAVGFGRAAVPSHVSMAPVGNATMPSGVGAPPPTGSQVGWPTPPQLAGMPSVPGAIQPGQHVTGPGVPPQSQIIGQMPGTGYPSQANPPPQYPSGPSTAPPVPVQPNAGFIAPPMPGAHPAVAPAAPQLPGPPMQSQAPFVCPLGAPTGYRMVNATGAQYAAFKGNRWTDDQLLQAGHMVRL